MADPERAADAIGGTVAELHMEPSVFHITAAGFVAISMLVVLGIMLWQRVPQLVAKLLDARIDDIRRQLDEASRLRAEAEAMLTAARDRTANQSAEAAGIVARAEDEARTLLAKAETDARDLVARRAGLAEAKIAAAERQALGEVRARSAEAAVRAARAVIADRNTADADRAAVDRAIAGLGRPN